MVFATIHGPAGCEHVTACFALPHHCSPHLHTSQKLPYSLAAPPSYETILRVQHLTCFAPGMLVLGHMHGINTALNKSRAEVVEAAVAVQGDEPGFRQGGYVSRLWRWSRRKAVSTTGGAKPGGRMQGAEGSQQQQQQSRRTLLRQEAAYGVDAQGSSRQLSQAGDGLVRNYPPSVPGHPSEEDAWPGCVLHAASGGCSCL